MSFPQGTTALLLQNEVSDIDVKIQLSATNVLLILTIRPLGTIQVLRNAVIKGVGCQISLKKKRYEDEGESGAKWPPRVIWPLLKYQPSF